MTIVTTTNSFLFLIVFVIAAAVYNVYSSSLNAWYFNSSYMEDEKDYDTSSTVAAAAIADYYWLPPSADRSTNTLFHVTDNSCCGLGHRLVRMAQKYHLMKSLNMTHIHVFWGVCNNNDDGAVDPNTNNKAVIVKLWPHLFGVEPLAILPSNELIFGKEPLIVPSNYTLLQQQYQQQMRLDESMTPMAATNNTNNDNTTMLITKEELPKQKRIQLFNEISGAYSSITARPWKEAILIPNRYELMQQQQGGEEDEKRRLFLSKVYSDTELYHRLWLQFRDYPKAVEFARRHRFEDHYVVALHVRAGNGEQGDFTQKNRGVHDLEGWVDQTAKLLHEYHTQSLWTVERNERDVKPMMIFLATDTPDVRTLLTAAALRHSIPVVSYPQEYVQKGMGVSYTLDEGTQCMQGWVSQIMDMGILGGGGGLSVDLVVAGQYSSFTQAFPLFMSLGIAPNPKKKHDERPIPVERSSSTLPMKESSSSTSQDYNEENGSSSEQQRRRIRASEIYGYHKVNPNGRFCEMGVNGDVMECFDHMEDFAIRKRSVPLFGNEASPLQEYRSLSFYLPAMQHGRYEEAEKFVRFERMESTMVWDCIQRNSKDILDVGCI